MDIIYPWTITYIVIRNVLLMKVCCMYVPNLCVHGNECPDTVYTPLIKFYFLNIYKTARITFHSKYAGFTSIA